MHDDGDWVAIIIEWIDGAMPTAPLDHDDVDRLLGLVGRLSSIEGGDALKSCSDAHPGLFGHWQHLIDQPIGSLDAW